ncbi:MAG: HEAT repeat domain-containing protein [Myxococcota bacterium]
MLLFLAAGCLSSEPTYVSTRDLDKAHATGDTAALCAGLKMKDEKTRSLAAEKLKDYTLDNSCLCERLSYGGRWDPAIVGGLKGGKEPALACVGALLDDPKQPDRAALAKALVQIPAAKARVREAAAGDADAEVRAAALAVYAGTKDPEEIALLVKGLGENPDAAWRAGAAATLLGQAAAKDALTAAAQKDADAGVRAAALNSLHALHADGLDEVLCGALADADAGVRAKAASLMKGTRDAEQLACLGARVVAEEPDPGVRAAVLDAVKASGSPEAAKVLCDGIAPWVKLNVKDAVPGDDEGILRAQNDRDPDHSYDCAAAAMKRTAGFTCHGRQYVAAFYKDVGGKVGVPDCDGKTRRVAASNEVSFE